MQKTLVSIILTTYNSEKTLQRTLDSVFHQHGIGIDFEIELICIDDCSTDNTLKILQKNRVTWRSIEQNSGGPNKGRNIGLRLATGDFICFLDHDDAWKPDKLLKQLKFKDYPIISSGIAVIFKQRVTYKCMQKIKNPFLNQLAINGKGININTLMISSALKDIIFEENFGFCDYDYMLRILENNKVYNIPEILLYKFIDSNNLSQSPRCQIINYYYSLYILEKYNYPQVKQAQKRLNARYARFWYKQGYMRKARKHFLYAGITPLNIAYILTTFIGHSIIKKYIK